MAASGDTIDIQAVLTVLGEEGFVHFADGQWNWTSESYPADAVSLRSISSDNFVVVDRTPGQGERVIGWPCKDGRHGDACDVELHALDDAVVCHCECHGRRCHR